MAELLWLPGAKDDIERLFTFLREKSPQAARNALKAIRLGAKQLVAFPQAGRPMDDETGRRELIVAFGGSAYVLRYKMDGKLVVILRVWHGREDR
ncbi:MAG: type II toxin-antitoxin system RelE/ParE family toxin [Deltaproteobacteria bacterium]|nr:type II toxin-antitoxin system RelE/ParE family toxin [Deltaproteobacteria bacterium]